MKIALVTTTINVPDVLRLYRAAGPDVAFFVAGDDKTPPEATMGSDAPHFMDVEYQKSLGYACSDLIGWGTISRRNIAILEALKWGAEIIVTIDDDNIPMSTDYFDRFEMVLGSSFSGLAVKDDGYWWDVGRYLIPKAPHRGFPIGWAPTIGFDHVVDAKIGVAAGICLGDPDISAVERIANAPIVHGVSEVLRAGVAVDPNMHTVFNSQNTAFLRELAPCFLMVPQFSRYDDIFASLIAQRVMRERNLHVHFGQPFVWQQRNAHNLVSDLKAEMYGIEHVTHFAEMLDKFVLYGRSVIEDVRMIYSALSHANWMPDGVNALASAWLDDCERVL